jgi:hypothetical protein
MAITAACGGAGDEDPAYAIIGNPGYEGQPSKLFVVSTLTAEGEAELEGQPGVPLPVPLFYMPHRSGVAYGFDAEQNLLELSVESAPVLRESRRLSLASLDPGVTRSRYVPIFISPTKVYLYSPSTLRMLVWNPREMAATHAFSLGLDIAEGFDSRSYAAARIIDGQLVLITHSGLSGADPAFDLTVTLIDLEADEVLSHEVDPRCTDVRSFLADDGDLYLTTPPAVAVAHRQRAEGAEPCVLRMLAGHTSLDSDYQGSFTDFVGSRLWGSLMRGPSGEPMLLVAPEVEADAVGADLGSQLWAPIWQLWRVDLKRDSATRYDSLPRVTGYQQYAYVDSRLYLRLADSLTGGETLVDISDPARPTPGLHLPFDTQTLFRLR